MSLMLGTQNIATVPANMINTVNELNNLYSDLNNRLNSRVYLKESYVNGTSGYNIWSNGYCEQWGKVDGTTLGTAGTSHEIKMIKTFANKNYRVILNGETRTAGDASYYPLILNEDNFTFTWGAYSSGSKCNYVVWEAKGYLASGQY